VSDTCAPSALPRPCSRIRTRRSNARSPGRSAGRCAGSACLRGGADHIEIGDAAAQVPVEPGSDLAVQPIDIEVGRSVGELDDNVGQLIDLPGPTASSRSSTALTVKSTLLGLAQNEKVQQLTESSKRSPPGPQSSSHHADWHRLRHELRPHAPATLGRRLPSLTARNGVGVNRPLTTVPTAQVALNVATVTARQPLASAGKQTIDALL
jgi:hypothetical protein